MDKEDLQALTRDDLQNIARNHDVRSSGKSRDIIHDLVQKFPGGVPRRHQDLKMSPRKAPTQEQLGVEQRPDEIGTARHAHTTRTMIPSAVAGHPVESPLDLRAAEEWIRNNFGDGNAEAIEAGAKRTRMEYPPPDDLNDHQSRGLFPSPSRDTLIQPKPERHSPTLDFVDNTAQWAEKVHDSGRPVCGASRKETRRILRDLATQIDDCIELENRINEESELLGRANQEFTSINGTLGDIRAWRLVLHQRFMIDLKRGLQSYFKDNREVVFPLSKSGPVPDQPSSSFARPLEILPPGLDAVKGDEYADPASTDSEVSLIDPADDDGDDDDSNGDRPDGENGGSGSHRGKGSNDGEQDKDDEDDREKFDDSENYDDSEGDDDSEGEDEGEDDGEDYDDGGDYDDGEHDDDDGGNNGDDRHDGGNGGSGGHGEGREAKASSGDDDEKEDIPPQVISRTDATATLQGREPRSLDTAHRERDETVENKDRGEGPSTSSRPRDEVASSSGAQGSSSPPAQERPQVVRHNRPPRPLQAEASFSHVVNGVPVMRDSMRARHSTLPAASTDASRGPVQAQAQRLGTAPLRASVPPPPLFQASTSTFASSSRPTSSSSSRFTPAPARPAYARPLKRRRVERDDSDPEVDNVEAEKPEEDEEDAGGEQVDDDGSSHEGARSHGWKDRDPQTSPKGYRRRT